MSDYSRRESSVDDIALRRAIRSMAQQVDAVAFFRDVVGADLQPSGNRFRMRCPFSDHEDRTPSCFIFPETNSFYCFGCGRGGPVHIFMLHPNGLGMDLSAAATMLSEMTGIPLEEALERPARIDLDIRGQLDDVMVRFALLTRRLIERGAPFSEIEELRRRVDDAVLTGALDAEYLWDLCERIEGWLSHSPPQDQ